MLLRNLLVQHLGLAPFTAVSITMKHDETGMSDITETVKSGHFNLIFFALKLLGINLHHLPVISGCDQLCILKPQETKVMKRLPADGIPALLAIIPEPKEGLPEPFLLPCLLVSATLPEGAFQYSLLYVISCHPTEIIFLEDPMLCPMPYSCNTSTMWRSQAARPNRPKAPSNATHADHPGRVNTTHSPVKVVVSQPVSRVTRGGKTTVLAVDIGCEAFCYAENQERLRFSGWLVGNRNSCKLLIFEHC